MSASFKPKQIVAIDETSLQEFLGSATEAISHDFLQPLVPLPAGSHIHDNGCGSGAITKALFALQPPSHEDNLDMGKVAIRVSATDKSAAAAARVQSMAASEGWPGTALGFPDGTFSHSLTGFVFLQLGEGADEACAGEIYRTLRPGGLAVVATWEDLPSMAVFRRAVERLHGDDEGDTPEALPDMLQMQAYGGRQVEQAMLRARFPPGQGAG
ncbi:S-adenosyl-L-methionine-dependent methyltransferase [Apiospora rasikravindrae]|uniref:S-adenosyl-L-methionine-dependent methyltransferase n=1 Tax=Apiospora rasikravindrae TaxID=990691 RepID=A0ABR1TDU3_9PEZI